MDNNLMTTKELCDYLKVSRMSIERWRKEGLPFINIGRNIRFKLDDVMNWIEEKKKGE